MDRDQASREAVTDRDAWEAVSEKSPRVRVYGNLSESASDASPRVTAGGEGRKPPRGLSIESMAAAYRHGRRKR